MLISVLTHSHTSDESAAGRDEGRAFDGVEGGFDAIIVEVDFDSLPVDERPKRQLSLSGMLGLFLFKEKIHTTPASICPFNANVCLPSRR